MLNALDQPDKAERIGWLMDEAIRSVFQGRTLKKEARGAWGTKYASAEFAMWNDIAEFAGRSAAVVMPIMGLQLALHKLRSYRLDLLEGKVDKLDADFDGMVRQVAATVIEIERRFVTKPDHIEAMRLLGVSIATLTATIAGFDNRLFDLMRERR